MVLYFLTGAIVYYFFFLNLFGIYFPFDYFCCCIKANTNTHNSPHTPSVCVLPVRTTSCISTKYTYYVNKDKYWSFFLLKQKKCIKEFINETCNDTNLLKATQQLRKEKLENKMKVFLMPNKHEFELIPCVPVCSVCTMVQYLWFILEIYTFLFVSFPYTAHILQQIHCHRAS